MVLSKSIPLSFFTALKTQFQPRLSATQSQQFINISTYYISNQEKTNGKGIYQSYEPLFQIPKKLMNYFIF